MAIERQSSLAEMYPGTYRAVLSSNGSLGELAAKASVNETQLKVLTAMQDEGRSDIGMPWDQAMVQGHLGLQKIAAILNPQEALIPDNPPFKSDDGVSNYNWTTGRRSRVTQ